MQADLQHAIRVHNVTKRYGNFTAVDALSFEVAAGEIFALLGPNGAGKTTMIRMILDILRPDEGEIAVFGGPMTEQSKQRIGYLPEERGLYRNVSVLEVLMYLGQLKGMKRQAARERALALLEEVGLGEHARSKIRELSKGMQQKVQIIATVLHEPQLIIVDEPFSGLDPVNTRLIKDMLYRMRTRGTTIVMSTHQMHQVEEMADRLLMLNRGRRVLYGRVDEVRGRFARNAVIVEGEGDWAALPGVARVERGENGRGVLLHLAEGVTPDDVMAALARGENFRVRRFELAVPRLDEIFVEVAGAADPTAEEGAHVLA